MILKQKFAQLYSLPELCRVINIHLVTCTCASAFLKLTNGSDQALLLSPDLLCVYSKMRNVTSLSEGGFYLYCALHHLTVLLLIDFSAVLGSSVLLLCSYLHDFLTQDILLFGDSLHSYTIKQHRILWAPVNAFCLQLFNQNWQVSQELVMPICDSFQPLF